MSAYVPQPYNAFLDTPVSYASQSLTGAEKTQARSNIGAASSLVVTQTDFTETYRYYGGLVGSDWKINRYSTTTFVKTSATIANNPSRANLSAAWTNRLTLTYA